MPLVSQQVPPIDRIRGIRDRFVEGGSAGEILIVVVILIALLILAHAVATFLRQRRNRRINNPSALYRDVLASLKLDQEQLDLMHRMAADLRLDHPVTILLSPQLYARYCREWIGRRRIDPAQLTPSLEKIRHAVFAPPSADTDQSSATQTG